MYILDQNSFTSFELENSSDFIKFWNNFYTYEVKEENGSGYIDYFKELNIGKDLTDENIKKLLRWKDPKYLSETIKSGKNRNQKNNRVLKVLGKINQINEFRNKQLDESAFEKELLECFPKGKGIWNIFLKHIAQPNRYPIYDQHVYRAFCYHCNESENNITINYSKYKEYFFSIYENSVMNSSIDSIKEMKKIDNALMAFGQFLKRYGNRI